MKVTIRYMDDSISVIDVEGDELVLNSTDEYFTIEDDSENVVGWIVRANVKYVIMGELIDNFKDTKDKSILDEAKKESEY